MLSFSTNLKGSQAIGRLWHAKHLQVMVWFVQNAHLVINFLFVISGLRLSEEKKKTARHAMYKNKAYQKTTEATNTHDLGCLQASFF